MASSEAGSTAWNNWPKPGPNLPLKPAQRTWSRRSAPRRDQRICWDLFMRRFGNSFTEEMMDAIIERCTGLDVHQATVVACVLLGEAARKPRKEIRTFSTMTRDLEALRGPEGPIVRKCTVRPRISGLKSPQDRLCLTVLHACLAVAGFIACNHGMQMELPGLSAAVLPHWTQ